MNKCAKISKSYFVWEIGHLAVCKGGFSPKEGANAISELPAVYMTPLFMPLEGQMVSLHQNWASKGLYKLTYFIDPKRTVYSNSAGYLKEFFPLFTRQVCVLLNGMPILTDMSSTRG